jgi:hypothetical protein
LVSFYFFFSILSYRAEIQAQERDKDTLSTEIPIPGLDIPISGRFTGMNHYILNRGSKNKDTNRINSITNNIPNTFINSNTHSRNMIDSDVQNYPQDNVINNDENSKDNSKENSMVNSIETIENSGIELNEIDIMKDEKKNDRNINEIENDNRNRQLPVVYVETTDLNNSFEMI